MRPLIASMTTLALNSELWGRRLLLGGRPFQGRYPPLEVNAGPCPEKPDHLSWRWSKRPRRWRTTSAGPAARTTRNAGPTIASRRRRRPHGWPLGSWLGRGLPSLPFRAKQGAQLFQGGMPEQPFHHLPQFASQIGRSALCGLVAAVAVRRTAGPVIDHLSLQCKAWLHCGESGRFPVSSSTPEELLAAQGWSRNERDTPACVRLCSALYANALASWKPKPKPCPSTSTRRLLRSCSTRPVRP